MKILLIALLALFSNSDNTYTIPRAHSITENIAVDSGKWQIEAFAYNDSADITCTYKHLGEVVEKQTHMHHCIATTNLALPAYFEVSVVNNENHSIVCKVVSRAIK